MKEYEILYKYLNGCAGEAYPQTTFDEAELTDTDSYVRARHSVEFEKFTKETTDAMIRYYYSNGAVTHIYEFTEI